jgi:hypothetical protein
MKTMTRQEMYEEAGLLNNHPRHIYVDKTTCMGFMTDEQCLAHIEMLKKEIEIYEAAR